jgi:DNA-binding response OmpR family regulator
LTLPRTKRAILNIVQRRPGISAEELRNLVWADDPAGGPEDRKTIHVHVSQLNKRLAVFGIAVRGGTGGYRIVPAASERN